MEALAEFESLILIINKMMHISSVDACMKDLAGFESMLQKRLIDPQWKKTIVKSIFARLEHNISQECVITKAVSLLNNFEAYDFKEFTEVIMQIDTSLSKMSIVTSAGIVRLREILVNSTRNDVRDMERLCTLGIVQKTIKFLENVHGCFANMSHYNVNEILQVAWSTILKVISISQNAKKDFINSSGFELMVWTLAKFPENPQLKDIIQELVQEIQQHLELLPPSSNPTKKYNKNEQKQMKKKLKCLEYLRKQLELHHGKNCTVYCKRDRNTGKHSRPALPKTVITMTGVITAWV